MSDQLKENAQPCDREAITAMVCDREAITAMVESIKAFFAGMMATRGRRTDLNRNVFYAAAEAVTPKGLREKKRIHAMVRLTGMRHDAISKGAEFRNEMDDSKLPLVERELHN
jgi:hypothetical protein